MAAAGMMYGASVYAVDPPTAGPFGSGKITFTGTITNSPVISHRATMRSPFRLDRFLTVNWIPPMQPRTQNRSPFICRTVLSIRISRTQLAPQKMSKWPSLSLAEPMSRKGLHHQRQRTACWCPATEEWQHRNYRAQHPDAGGRRSATAGRKQRTQLLCPANSTG